MFQKNTWSLMNYKELICLQQTKVLVLTTEKKGCCMNGKKKKIWKYLLSKKHLWGKPVHLSFKYIVNNADTWGVHTAVLSALVGQQIQLYTLWSESRQHKFTDIGNSIFC